MKLPIYQVDAFAESRFEGNPAAVCPLENWLPDSLLQAISAENNLSETAFYVKNGDRYDLRWFTPTSEVDLCGHATLATAYIIFQQTDAEQSEIVFDSRSGELRVTKQGELLTLDFPEQIGEPCATPIPLIEGLGATPIATYRAMDYMAVFETEEQIATMSPDFKRLMDLDLRGVIVTAHGNHVDFVSRVFAPNYGVNEDPVTGSAHCTLAPYWGEKLGKRQLSARQLSKRGGSLHCELQGDRVLISGKVAPYLEGSIEVG